MESFYKLTTDLTIGNRATGDEYFIPQGTIFNIKKEGPLVLLETYPFYPTRGSGYAITVKKEFFNEHKSHFKKFIQ